MQVWVNALKGFEHYGTRQRGERFQCSRHIAVELEAKGLVEIPEHQPPPERPTGADGTPSSASPAVPASPQTTSSASGDGDSPDEPRPSADEASPESGTARNDSPTGRAPPAPKRKRTGKRSGRKPGAG